MSLLALQRDFGAWLRTGDGEDAARLGTEYARGLRVYRNNYHAQLVTCLEATFARTREWIGEEAFHEALAIHIDRVPPSAWTIDAYGRDFPETLAALYAGDPEISELAWLERALDDAFVAADHAIFDASSIADVDWDSAILSFSSTINIAELRTNAPAIWSAISSEKVPPPAEMLPAPGAILVWRKAGVSCFRALERLERDVLIRAQAGYSFASLCEMLVEVHGQSKGVAIAGELLGRWIADCLIVTVGR
jgi:hypothetical protein